MASVAALSLSNGDLFKSLLSSILVVALLIVYGALTARPKDGPYQMPVVDIEASITGVSIRVVALLVVGLGIQSVALGLLTSSVFYVLLLGFSKASSWFFMIQLVSNAPLSSTSNILLTAPDPKHLVVDGHHDRDFCHRSHEQSFPRIIRDTSSMPCHGVIICALPNHSLGFGPAQGKINSLGLFSPLSSSISFQYLGDSKCTTLFTE